MSNIKVDSTRKISDCKINALTVECVPNTFENLNCSEMTSKMLKMMQIYQKCKFWGFIVFCLFLIFFWNFIKNMGKKLGSNRCPLFTMLTKQKFLNVLHSKLAKKTKGLPGLLSDPLSQGLRFSKENGLIILGDLPILKKSGLFSRATCPLTLTLVYFQGRPAHTYSHWSIFTGDLPTHTHAGLFSGRPAHTYSRWSIFTGDLPKHTHCGLFSRATCPHTVNPEKNQGWIKLKKIN